MNVVTARHLDLPEISVPSLVNRRRGRYQGDDLCVRLDQFAETDRRVIESTYHFLQGLFAPLKGYHADADESSLARIQSLVDGLDLDERLDDVRRLGAESMRSERAGELLGKTVHDLRGGALSGLLGQLQCARVVPLDQLKGHQLFFLTRDHLKIMRNALLGLDDAKRQADLLPTMHGVDLIVEKWQDAVLGENGHRAAIRVDSDYLGNIAECCVEFGALDRVLYNLINNACRHTASGEVHLLIHGASDGCHEPENLLFCVSNPVGDKEKRWLSERGDLRALFQPGVSSTGSGLGMSVAADFVTNAYGLGSHAIALNGGYLGAHLRQGEFQAWFHWPVAADV